MMKTIVLATGNKDKAREIKAMLDHKFEVKTMKDMGIDIEIIEDGDTFEDNALIKVRAIQPFVKDSEMIIMGMTLVCRWTHWTAHQESIPPATQGRM